MKNLLEIKFKPLKDNCMHVRCPDCGRPYSNIIKNEFDPKDAVFAEMLCPKCAEGCKDAGPEYYDKNGNYVDFE